MQKEKVDVYKMVTDKIVDALESMKKAIEEGREARPPWVKSWKCSDYGGLPFNGVSKKAYSGINILLLLMSEFSSPDWYTFKQLKAKGGMLEKGTKGTHVIFFKRYTITDRKTDEEKEIPLIRYYTVFNRDQIKGLKARKKRSEPLPKATPADIDEMLNDLNLQSGVINGEPCYMPSRDGIKLPKVEDFESEDHFKSVALHEAVHATGHKSRLDRDLKNSFGTPGYAFEELIAEIGSAMCCARLGVECDKLRHVDYIASWLEALKNDKKMIIKAASQASKASMFLLPEVGAAKEAKAA